MRPVLAETILLRFPRPHPGHPRHPSALIRPIALTVGLILSCAATALGQTTFLVLPDGTGDFPTIQAAVDAAVPGDIIELGDGTFSGEGNRDIDNLGKGITIRSQSGNPEACIIQCDGSAAEPHHGFHIFSLEGPCALLEGLTVTGGAHPGDQYQYGGGAVCINNNATIRNCILIGNEAGYGGGLHTGSDILVEDCVFAENQAGAGGGVYCDGGHPSFVRCLFRDNTTGGGGGGSAGWWDGPTYVDCTFVGNHAGRHGGGCFSGFPTLRRCLFLENTAGRDGGGAYMAETCIELSECVFSHNVAQSGGGIWCLQYGQPRIEWCTFTGNEAAEGSAIHLVWSAAVCLVENTILAYGVGSPPVLCSEGASATLSCCDVFGNEGGDWVGCIAGQAGVSGNLSLDPQFCSLSPHEHENWSLQSDSPCAPGQSPCGQIGAWGVGCGSTGPVQRSWGQVKWMFGR